LGIGCSPLPNLRGDVKNKRQQLIQQQISRTKAKSQQQISRTEAKSINEEEADCMNDAEKCTERRRRSTVKNKERKEEG